MKIPVKMTAILIGATFLFVVAKSVLAADQTTCPVMGGKITYRLFSDVAEKRVFFCCPGCKQIFEKDPEKYFQKMKELGQDPLDISALSK